MSKKDPSQQFKSNIWKIYVYVFFHGLNTVVGVMVPFFTIWGKISFVEVMFLQSYFTFIIFILEIPSGAIADFFGRKWGLSLAAFVLALAVLAYSSIPNISMFIIGETLWAFGSALISGTDEALIFSTLKELGEEEKLPKILGRTHSFFLIALTISGPLGSIMAELISLQFTMTFLFFPYLIAGFVAITFKNPSKAKKDKTQNYLAIIKEGFKELRKNKILRILSIDRILVGTLVFFLFWTYQPYLLELNLPLFYLGFISSIITISDLVFSNFIPNLFKRTKYKRTYLIISTLVVGISFVIMGFTTFVPFSILLVVLIAAFGYTRWILFINGINNQIESENRATVLSTINMFGSIFSAIFYPIIGYLVMWNIFGATIIIGALIILLTLFSRVKNEYL